MKISEIEKLSRWMQDVFSADIGTSELCHFDLFDEDYAIIAIPTDASYDDEDVPQWYLNRASTKYSEDVDLRICFLYATGEDDDSIIYETNDYDGAVIFIVDTYIPSVIEMLGKHLVDYIVTHNRCYHYGGTIEDILKVAPKIYSKIQASCNLKFAIQLTEEVKTVVKKLLQEQGFN